MRLITGGLIIVLLGKETFYLDAKRDEKVTSSLGNSVGLGATGILFPFHLRKISIEFSCWFMILKCKTIPTNQL